MYYLEKLLPFEACESLAKKEVNTLNHNQLEHLSGEILAHIFWHNKKASFSTATNLQIAYLNRLGKYILKCLKRSTCPVEVNSKGLRIDRSTTSLESHQYEQLLGKIGNWSRMLNLDFYRCYWINEKSLQIISFVEGDVITLSAINLEQLNLEKDDIILWHKMYD